MKNFLEILRAESAELDRLIAECEGYAMRLPGLRKKKQGIEALAASYVDQEVSGQSDDEPFVETSREKAAEDALGAPVDDPPKIVEVKPPMVVAKVEITQDDPPRGADPSKLFLSEKKLATNGAAVSSLQKQVVLAESSGIKATLFPAQIAGPTGAPMDCSDLQASIVAVLVKVMPALVGDQQLVDQAYRLAGRKATSGSLNMIAYEVRDINNKLVRLGAEIVTTKGIGRSIKVL